MTAAVAKVGQRYRYKDSQYEWIVEVVTPKTMKILQIITNVFRHSDYIVDKEYSLMIVGIPQDMHYVTYLPGQDK
jgi:nitrate reductase gamma subunit